MNLIIALSLCLLSALPPALAGEARAECTQNGSDILRESDAKLIPATCSYRLRLTSTTRSDKSKLDVFKGFKEGDSRNVLIVQAPERAAGTVHLRKDEVIWSYHTTNHKLTKVGYQAIFMGTLLNYGDVLATELTLDYDVDSCTEREEVYELRLTPKKGKGSYGAIELVVEKLTLEPRTRKYFALSGILLKECSFTVIERENGQLTRLVMEFKEPLKQRTTVAEFDAIAILEDVPDKYFNENFLPHLSVE